MIVKLISIKKNLDLSTNRDYKVLSIDFIQKIEVPPQYNIKLRLISDKGIAALYDINLFEVTEPSIDQDFVYKNYHNGNFELVPKSMSYNCFWDDFFDDDEKARLIFKLRFPEYKDILF